MNLRAASSSLGSNVRAGPTSSAPGPKVKIAHGDAACKRRRNAVGSFDVGWADTSALPPPSQSRAYPFASRDALLCARSALPKLMLVIAISSRGRDGDRIKTVAGWYA